jgi:cytochrome c oxidase cbb3-type subunit 3
MSKKPVTQKPEPPTTGHAWDGIREYDNPMPRWWLWVFYLTIVWGLAYTVLYPAWPLVSQATRGLWGGTTRAEVAADIRHFEALNAPVEARLVATGLDAIAADPELANYTANAGRAVFRTWCAQCHGSGAAGAKGFPNLLDNDWLWGGTLADIHTTVSHGIRNTTDADARFSQMPAFGDLLEEADIDAAVNHVLAISGQDHDAALAARGAQVFAENCVSCHMEDGTGDRAQGAPNLTDAIWLWGGDAATIKETVTRARFGVMPAWAGKLTEADIRAVASYVHGLGGGEAAAPASN